MQVFVREPADVDTLADQACLPRYILHEAGILLQLLLRQIGLPLLSCELGVRSLITIYFAIVGSLSEGVVWEWVHLLGFAVVTAGRSAFTAGGCAAEVGWPKYSLLISHIQVRSVVQSTFRHTLSIVKLNKYAVELFHCSFLNPLH